MPTSRAEERRMRIKRDGATYARRRGPLSTLSTGKLLRSRPRPNILHISTGLLGRAHPTWKSRVRPSCGLPIIRTSRADFCPKPSKGSTSGLPTCSSSRRNYRVGIGPSWAGKVRLPSDDFRTSCAEEDWSRRPLPGGFGQELESVAQDELQLGIVTELSSNVQERFASRFSLKPRPRRA
jgi:hypothetical protein